MVAYNLKGVRDAFADDKLASAFGRKFIEAYAATAFGSLPKTEIDLQVFSLLVDLKVIETNRAAYRMARALNITPTKAQTLLFQYQLRNISEDDTDHEIMLAITTAKYWKDGDKLSFGVTSPLVKAALTGKMEEKGVFADVSLSGNILRVDPGRFGAILNSLLSDSQAKRVIGLLKDKKLVDDKTLRAAIEKKGTDLAKKFVEKAAEKGAQEGFGGCCQSNGNSSPVGHGKPKPTQALAHDCTPLGQGGRASLPVLFSADEVTLQTEMIVN